MYRKVHKTRRGQINVLLFIFRTSRNYKLTERVSVDLGSTRQVREQRGTIIPNQFNNPTRNPTRFHQLIKRCFSPIVAGVVMTKKPFDDSNWREEYKNYTTSKYELGLLKNGAKQLSQSWILGALYQSGKR